MSMQQVYDKRHTNCTRAFRVFAKQAPDVRHPVQPNAHADHELAGGYVHTRYPLCNWMLHLHLRQGFTTQMHGCMQDTCCNVAIALP